jgi:hypothetical protein
MRSGGVFVVAEIQIFWFARAVIFSLEVTKEERFVKLWNIRDGGGGVLSSVQTLK